MGLTRACAVVGLLIALHVMGGLGESNPNVDTGLSSDWQTRSRSFLNGRISSDNQELTENNNRAKRSPVGSEDTDYDGLSLFWQTQSRSRSNGRLSSGNQELIENNNRAKRSTLDGVAGDGSANGTSNTNVDTGGVFLVSSHRGFVPSLTEKVNLTCNVDFPSLPNNTWRYLEKLVIKHKDSSHDYLPIASIDFVNNIRKSVNGAEVTGYIRGINDSHLTIFYKHAESLQPGNYKCVVQGYQDDYNAPWLTGYSKEISLQAKEPDIETLVKEIRTDKDSIKSNRQNMAKLDGLLNTFNSYIDFLDSKADLYLEHWPDGVYSLLQTKTGCSPDMPREWNVVDVHFYTKTGRMNTDKVPAHFSGERIYDASSSYIRESFCQHDVIGHYPWPAGDYCIHPLNVMSDCPANFERGIITLFWEVTSDSLNSELDMEAVPVTETIDTENHVGELSVEFCCRNDSLFNTSVALPTQSPFYLYQGQSQNCQSVKGMKYVVEEIRYDTADRGLDTNSGKTPRHTLNDVTLYLCYYTPDSLLLKGEPTASDGGEDGGDGDA